MRCKLFIETELGVHPQCLSIDLPTRPILGDLVTLNNSESNFNGVFEVTQVHLNIGSEFSINVIMKKLDED